MDFFKKDLLILTDWNFHFFSSHFDFEGRFLIWVVSSAEDYWTHEGQKIK